MAHNKNKNFTHLSQEEMIEIYSLLREWLKYRAIWRKLHRHHTTISREVTRNSIDYWRDNTKYRPLQAYEKQKKRRKKANIWHIKLRKNKKLRSMIFMLLSDPTKYRWPDEILWYLKREWWNVVSTSTLYRYIRWYTNWWKYLRYWRGWYKHRKWKRKITTTIPWILRIDQRPDSANQRLWQWDWEVDTIVDPWHSTWLFTATNRKTRYEIIEYIPNHKSVTLLTIMTYALQNHHVESITSDNGSEFAQLATLCKRLKAKWYAAYPWRSYERWTNERHNWLIRSFIPKKTKASGYTRQEIQHIADLLNHKPRKILWYRTPYELHYNTTINYLKR